MMSVSYLLESCRQVLRVPTHQAVAAARVPRGAVLWRQRGSGTAVDLPWRACGTNAGLDELAHAVGAAAGSAAWLQSPLQLLLMILRPRAPLLCQRPFCYKVHCSLHRGCLCATSCRADYADC
jgi:hypothetical protein